MNPFKTTIYRQGSDGRVFSLHWKNRHGPMALPLLLVGTGIQAYGQYQQGQTAAAQAEAQQETLRYNAQLKEQQARAELIRSQEEARKFQRQGEQLQGAQAVAIAKGGVLSSGSPLLVIEDTANELEKDRLSILRDGYLAESFRKSEATGLRYQASAIDPGAFRRAGTINAFGSILTGVGTYGALGGSFPRFGSPKIGIGSAGVTGPHIP